MVPDLWLVVVGGRHILRGDWGVLNGGSWIVVGSRHGACGNGGAVDGQFGVLRRIGARDGNAVIGAAGIGHGVDDVVGHLGIVAARAARQCLVIGALIVVR